MAQSDCLWVCHMYVHLSAQSIHLTVHALQANYSFSGALSPLSKLIVCAVMLRGRHRGLPVAIDRAVILPFEFRGAQDESFRNDDDETPPPRRASRDSTYGNGTVGDGVQSEKLQRRSWRTNTMDSGQQAERRSNREDVPA